MGAGQSKPDQSTKHVFASDTPIQFSQELIDSLQASSETNSTRAKTLELHIQQRVAEELEKIKKHESEALEAIRKKIAEESPSDSSSISPKDLIPGAKNDEEQKRKAQSSQKVQQEIEKLKQQLGQRKTLKELPKEVENACVTTLDGMRDSELTYGIRRQDVISCLRINDRKPLDCWKEVEIFKREVRKLEENYVSSVL
ncbi:putative altered inheritance of mitochondria protein 13, mitochondrial [Cladophialophora carrionii]|uniref:Putative altered inheritance of mitochondria protein 13, mitochondrial n=1 Tax=Cladophialophora carrionii TaxID=86049 RepID=A0A1C1CPJ5_9EURO|nr:putative altered inheritance of mitochondria protein 13, mitochondrial [Cladophialophora carrionii]